MIMTNTFIKINNYFIYFNLADAIIWFQSLHSDPHDLNDLPPLQHFENTWSFKLA